MTFRPLDRLPFRIRPSAGVYMPGRVLPTEARLYGEGVFLFESTDRPSAYNVRIEHISLRVIPFVMAFDIDNDGLLESIEITEADFTDLIDLENTVGEFDAESYQFRMNWAVRLSPTMIPFLSEPMTLTVADYGSLDPDTGEFEIHAGVFEIERGPLRGAVVRASASGCLPYTEIYLAVVISGEKSNCLARADYVPGRPKEVYACPGDTVDLCWILEYDTCYGTVYDRIEIEFENRTRSVPPTTTQTTVTVPMQYMNNPIEIKASLFDTNGDLRAEDTVIVHVYERGWIPLKAQPGNWGWSIEIEPDLCSKNIIVSSIQLLSSEPDCLPWQRFEVLHTPNYGYRPLAFRDPAKVGPPEDPTLRTWISDLTEVPLAPPRPVTGKWFFSAQDVMRDGHLEAKAPDPQDFHAPVCFRMRGYCQRPEK